MYHRYPAAHVIRCEPVPTPTANMVPNTQTTNNYTTNHNYYAAASAPVAADATSSYASTGVPVAGTAYGGGTPAPRITPHVSSTVPPVSYTPPPPSASIYSASGVPFQMGIPAINRPAHAAPPAQQPKQGDCTGEVISCAACTFYNPSFATVCEVCNTPLVRK